MTHRLREATRDHFAAFRLREYGGDRTPWIFHHTENRRRATSGNRISTLRRGFEAAVERAGLPSESNRHDLRHRRVTKWLAGGKPSHIVQKAMGQSDLGTTLHYEDLFAEDLLCLVDDPITKSAQETA